MEYKKLKSKEISQQQEKALEEQINKKLGGIDALLKKANQANPALFQGDSESAQKETQELVSNMKEEQKQQEDEKEAPENLIRPSYLKSIPASKHMSSAGIIKQLLKKTKTEVKGIERAKIAAK